MIKVGIVGAAGYAGAELVRLLLGHPQAEIVHLAADSSAGSRMEDLYGNLKGTLSMPLKEMDAKALTQDCDIVFTALPHVVSAKTVPQFLKDGTKVIDLSGDFRYRDAAVYEQWYGHAHPHPDLLKTAVYGMPELYKENIRTAQIVGNPGCYTTCSILALAPAIQAGIVYPNGIIIDAKSGVTGAGRKPTQDLHFCEVQDNFKAYKVTGHRHTSEIEQELSILNRAPLTLTFTPHLLPVKRGILATVYAPLTKTMTHEQISELYAEFFAGQPFVVLHGKGSLPELKHVTGSNYLHIGFEVDSRTNRIIIVAALDNLIKGAAGQAVQNMNLMFGLDETLGLKQVAYYL